VEQDQSASALARGRAPWALIHEGDFFAWAGRTKERFDCAAGNPPFIRYQRFAGETRQRALALCKGLGADFSGLASSWAPFLVAAASLLKPGGRMAFVVPAEIGHAPYSEPLLAYLASSFDAVQLIPVRTKIFPELSEDVWLLCAEGFGSATDHFILSPMEQFGFTATPPERGDRVHLTEWRHWNSRLRPFLLPPPVRDLYQGAAGAASSVRLGAAARVGIGYVTGDNDFFHLRPSEAAMWGIPESLLHPAVRNGRALRCRAVTRATVRSWTRRDEPVLLLRLSRDTTLPGPVKEYLATPAARKARETYKCRTRDPWYVVPDVTVPDGFLSYMSGERPALVANEGGCVCTNSVHAVTLTGRMSMSRLQEAWASPLTRLSCEIEGHPLGGGMLKLEPREACRVILGPDGGLTRKDQALIDEGVDTLRRWRHYG
jgi:hypothetical protein